MNNKQKYNTEYNREHYAKITINIKKDYKDIIKDRATDLKKSVNSYIIDLIMKDLDKR